MPQAQMDKVAGWLDLRDRNQAGEWGAWFRYFVVLVPQSATLELYENDSDPYQSRGQRNPPSATLSLPDFWLDASRAAEARHRPNALELFVGRKQEREHGAPGPQLPPRRLYSKEAGYAGSTVLQPGSPAERKMWIVALTDVMAPSEPEPEQHGSA